MTLIERLQRLAQLWADSQGKELSTLATLVAKDGKFFGRLAEGKTCTVTMFERFLSFFREGGNWPEGVIPADAAATLDEIEMIGTGDETRIGDLAAGSHAAQLSAGAAAGESRKGGDLTPQGAAEAA